MTAQEWFPSSTQESHIITLSRGKFARVTAQNKRFILMETTQFRGKTSQCHKTKKKTPTWNKKTKQNTYINPSKHKKPSKKQNHHKTTRHLTRCSTQPLTSWRQANVRKYMEKYQNKIITSKLIRLKHFW